MSKQKSILAIGDSITEWGFEPNGWGNLLQAHYKRKCDIFNRGFSGYNTEWMKHIVPQLCQNHQFGDVHLITLALGANDASLPNLNARQHVPLEKYEQNLLDLVRLLRKHFSAPILIITPPPIVEKMWLKRMQEFAVQNKTQVHESDRQFEITQKYALASLSVAQKCGEPNTFGVDMFSKMASITDWEIKFMSDGLHLTPEGNKFFFQQLLAAIAEHVPTLVESALPVEFPLWNNFDISQLPTSLCQNK